MDSTGNREAVFLGRVTASTTHEFRNVLAIVKESAGLIEDLVASGASDRPQLAERIARAVDRIDTQVGRGADLLTHLNRFAHSIDPVRDGTDLDQTVNQIVFLSQRLARRGRHELTVESGAGNQTVGSDSLGLQMAVYFAVECCLETVPEGGRVSVSTARTGERAAVTFTRTAADEAPLPSPETADRWSDLTSICSDLQASVDSDDSGRSFTLSFPERETL